MESGIDPGQDYYTQDYYNYDHGFVIFSVCTMSCTSYTSLLTYQSTNGTL